MARDRYCFERYAKEVVTYRDSAYEERDTLGYWAIYDRRAGLREPIAYTKCAIVAQKIVDGLNSGT